MLSPDQFPKLMLFSALASLAVGAIVFRVSGRWEVGLATGIFLFVADWIGIRSMMK